MTPSSPPSAVASAPAPPPAGSLSAPALSAGSAATAVPTVALADATIAVPSAASTPVAHATAALPTPPVVGAKRKAVDASPAKSAAAATGARPTNFPQRGRSFLNHQQRLEIIKKKDEEPKWTQVQLARWAAVHFGLPKEPSQATIAVLLKKREQLQAATVRPQTRTIRSPRHPELEAALLLWVRHLQSQRVAFTGENIRLKASELATKMDLATTLNFSTGWMSGFVTRHNLLLARAHKKKPSDGDDEPARTVLKGYDPRNVFALHETSLLYNALPFAHAAADENDEPADQRVSVGLAVNADGSEKLEPLLVTTCRRRVGVFAETFYNVDGHMTARIFEQWLYKLNQRMAASHRRVVVVVSAAPSHFPLQLSNVRLVVLPQAAAAAHPLDGSVTKSFKALYRRTHLSFAVDQAEEGRERVLDVSLARALVWMKQAWLDVAPELIRAGWARSGLVASTAAVPESVDIHPEVVQSLVVSLSQLQMLEAMPLDTLLDAPSEQGVHYQYDDATVMRVVAAEADEQSGERGATTEREDREEQEALALHAGGAELKLASEAAAHHLYHDPHMLQREPSPDELLANYRGVIWSLDADPERSEDHQTALRLLRRKQAALRLQQQQQPIIPRPAEQDTQPEHHEDTASATESEEPLTVEPPAPTDDVAAAAPPAPAPAVETLVL